MPDMAIVSAMRATAHVRRRGKHGWERLDTFLARVNLTLEQCRSWSRQQIADHVRGIELLEQKDNLTTENATQ
jgi:hypothetical protein